MRTLLTFASALAVVLTSAGAVGVMTGPPARQSAGAAPLAPAPLYRDPIYDGAADPSLVWNDGERAWWLFYTNRRANVPDAQAGVTWCHGTDIGIASSKDGGVTWEYRGTARGLEFESGRNTFWAPAVFEHGGRYHMFLAYVRGVPSDWSGERRLVHYTSRDLVNWSFEAVLDLGTHVIDAFVYPKPSGGWRMWFKDEADRSSIHAADSTDLGTWTPRGAVVTGPGQEGPAVFWWRGSYWMLVDRWKGMGVLRSADLERWQEQDGTILGEPGTRQDDGDIGRHGEVVVQGDEAYLVYFTHPAGRVEHTAPGRHRSSLQVARLELRDGRLTCDRNAPFRLALGPPSGFRPASPVASALALESPDRALAGAFGWAKAQALQHVFPAAVFGDPVGDWYEAALPSRFAFCMRDVSHQATGAHLLGLARFNHNMLRAFASGIAASRDYATYWEIDKFNRPAPVDYESDRNFWYNLPANFDVLDACWRQYQWSGNRDYVEGAAFARFHRLTFDEYIRAWDRNDDGIPEHRPQDGTRGIGSYDEGPIEQMAVGADLVAAQVRASRSYAAMRELLGDAPGAAARRSAADRLQYLFEASWYDEAKQAYAAALTPSGERFFTPGEYSIVHPLYFGLLPPGPRRDAHVRRLVANPPVQYLELESHLPEVLYRLGENEAAYREILALSAPSKKRREYPEVPFAIVGAVGTGTMGLEPDARTRTLTTRSRLTPATPWAELSGIPVFDTSVSVRHDGSSQTTLRNEGGGAIAWRACFAGVHRTVAVDGTDRVATEVRGEDGEPASCVDVAVRPRERHAVTVRR
jgi:hypothetical protein